ncbi:hypothetical protein JHK87_039360 [Glycine soja]|nr:hypothetical protein JHK87_039360 [Glycine soja]
MVTALTSTVDGDDAPSTVDGGVALHGNLLTAPHNLFTASSSSRQQWLVAEEEEEPFPTMVVVRCIEEVSVKSNAIVHRRGSFVTVHRRGKRRNHVV